MNLAEHLRIEAWQSGVCFTNANTNERLAMMSVEQAETFIQDLTRACAEIRANPSVAVVVAGVFNDHGHLYRIVNGVKVAVHNADTKCPHCGSWHTSPTRTQDEWICKSCLRTWLIGEGGR